MCLPVLPSILVYSCCTGSAGQAAATVPQSKRGLAGHRGRGAQLLTKAATSPSSRFLVGERSSHSLPGHTRTTRAAGGWQAQAVTADGSLDQLRGGWEHATARNGSSKAGQGCGTAHGTPCCCPCPPVTSSFVRCFRAWAMTALVISSTLPSFSLRRRGGGGEVCGRAGVPGGTPGLESGLLQPHQSLTPCFRQMPPHAAASLPHPTHLSAWQMACTTASASATSHRPSEAINRMPPCSSVRRTTPLTCGSADSPAAAAGGDRRAGTAGWAGAKAAEPKEAAEAATATADQPPALQHRLLLSTAACLLSTRLGRAALFAAPGALCITHLGPHLSRTCLPSRGRD